MQTEKSIRKLRDLMTERYRTGSANPDLDAVIMPADAFEVANTLNWVLEIDGAGIYETLNQAGIEL